MNYSKDGVFKLLLIRDRVMGNVEIGGSILQKG